jgi:hypothetical protein
MRTADELLPDANYSLARWFKLVLQVIIVSTLLFISPCIEAQEREVTCEVVATGANTVSSECLDVTPCDGPLTVVIQGNPGDKGAIRCGTGVVTSCIIAENQTSCTQSSDGPSTPQPLALCRVTAKAGNRTARAVCHFGSESSLTESSSIDLGAEERGQADVREPPTSR